MTKSQSQPGPVAREGVPAHAPDRADQLALGARVERGPDGGWRIASPLRAERVRPDRQTIVREEVVLSPRLVSDVQRVEGAVAREELRVDLHGDLEATQPIDRQ